jgi:zinc transport system substrate-binding protein
MSRRGLALLALACLCAGCPPASPPSAKPLVVATFYPLYEFSRQVAGDRADVVSLVPPGVEPHDWEPSPQDVIQVQKSARLLVYNGAGFEPWVDKLVTGAPGGSPVTVDTTRGLSLVAVGGAVDPHVWLDPVLARAQVDAIRTGLERTDPANAAAYADNARRFGERLVQLDEAFSAGLRDCSSRDMFTSHTAFTYLARRYRLTQVPVMGLAPESEPSPAQLAAIATLARRRGARYIFFETLVSARLAEALAREVGARTLVLNPIEGLTREEAAAGKSYVDLMEANLGTLRTGLACR